MKFDFSNINENTEFLDEDEFDFLKDTDNNDLNKDIIKDNDEPIIYEEGKGKLDYSGDEYELIRNINPYKRQSVNEEYDNLLKEKIKEQEKIETSIKNTLPAKFSKPKSDIIVTEKDIEMMKNPSMLIERKNVKSLDEIEKEDLQKYIEDDFIKGKYNKEKEKEVISIEDSLLDKIINNPNKYIKFKFDDTLVYNSYELGLSGYDCIIRPDGYTIFDSIMDRTTETKKYRKSIEDALLLDRIDIYSNDYIEGINIKDKPMFRRIDRQRSTAVRRRKEYKESIKRIDSQKKKQEMSNLLGIDISELNNLIKVPNTNTSYSNYEKNRWDRYYKSGDKLLMLTYEDRDIIRFLGQFKYSVSNILKNISGESFTITNGRLEKLKTMGLVNNYAIVGVGEIWTLTNIGIDMAGFNLASVTGAKLPSPVSITSNLGVQFVASFLYNNRVNVLNLKSFPYYGKQMSEEIIRGETLITEAQINSSINNEVKNIIKEQEVYKSPYVGFFTEQVGNKKRESMIEWENMVRNGYDVESPEFIKGMEYCWSIYPSRSVVGISYHNPDLVVKRPRIERKPQSIAIEVERKQSSAEDYRNTFMAYAMDNNTFKYVVWITPFSSNANKIRQGARLANFKNYKVLPLIDENGGVNVSDFWQLAYR